MVKRSLAIENFIEKEEAIHNQKCIFLIFKNGKFDF